MKKFRLMFDMDGTIADLYSTPNWLETLRSEQPIFANLAPMPMFEQVKEALATLRATNKDVEVVVVSWTPMNVTGNYERASEKEKLAWLVSTGFDTLIDGAFIVPYGTPKSQYASEDSETVSILFDDNHEVREEFLAETGSQAFDETQIVKVLTLLTEIGR